MLCNIYDLNGISLLVFSRCVPSICCNAESKLTFVSTFSASVNECVALGLLHTSYLACQGLSEVLGEAGGSVYPCQHCPMPDIGVGKRKGGGS